MLPEDMYVLSSHGSVLSTSSPKPYPNKLPKCTDCASLFMKAYQMRNAGAVIHSHGMESCIPTLIHPSAKEFRITHMEMIKGIQGHGYHDELVVPIIENTAHERELTESLSEVINAYPKATAVLVRNHGVYIWGDSWISAKTQAECYHYLFDAAIRLNQLGLDWSTSSHGPIHPVKRMDGVVKCCILLDIEGTTTPISFVTDVLFPYARHNLRKHLTSTYDTEETQEDIKLLRAQVDEDLKQGLSSVPIPLADSGKEDVITTLVANVEEMIKADRKVTSLKQLQVYIYSSGSREAQRLIFGHSNYGDLRRYLYGFFDTTIGHKRESRSYFEISQSLGVDKPSEILFLTDVYQEAVAAKTAGVEAIITVRPGNGPLPENHGFKTVQSFLEI